MLCLIKSENIFGRFCRDIYTIKYQKRGFSHIHFLILLSLADKFLEAFYINDVIYAELTKIEIDLTSEFIRIVTSVMIHGSYKEINPNSLYMSNARDCPPRYIKHYPHNFLEETFI